MEYVYAAMLLTKAGKNVDEASMKKVFDAAGVQVDDAKIKAVVAALDGVDIEAAIKEASQMTQARSSSS
jgi:large subunit ribosomal protein L12